MIAIDLIFKDADTYYTYNFEKLPDSLKANYEIHVDRTLKKKKNDLSLEDENHYLSKSESSFDS